MYWPIVSILDAGTVGDLAAHIRAEAFVLKNVRHQPPDERLTVGQTRAPAGLTSANFSVNAAGRGRVEFVHHVMLRGLWESLPWHMTFALNGDGAELATGHKGQGSWSHPLSTSSAGVRRVNARLVRVDMMTGEVRGEKDQVTVKDIGWGIANTLFTLVILWFVVSWILNWDSSEWESLSWVRDFSPTATTEYTPVYLPPMPKVPPRTAATVPPGGIVVGPFDLDQESEEALKDCVSPAIGECVVVPLDE